MDVVIYIVIQILTLVISGFCWYRLLPEKEMRPEVCTGIFFYFVCPFRLMYGWKEEQVWSGFALAVLPLVFLVFMGTKRQIEGYVLLGIALVIMGYTDFRIFLTVCLFVTLAAIFWRKGWAFLALGIAAVAVILGKLSWVRFIILGEISVECQLKSIMESGYDVSNLLRSFVSKQHKPGIGLALMLGLLLALWLLFVRGKKEFLKQDWQWIALGVLFTLLSTRYFPWDLVQRVDVRFLRLVSYMESPAYFFGVAQGCMAMIGAKAFGRMKTVEDRNTRVSLSCLILLLGIGETLILWKG